MSLASDLLVCDGRIGVLGNQTSSGDICIVQSFSDSCCNVHLEAVGFILLAASTKLLDRKDV